MLFRETQKQASFIYYNFSNSFSSLSYDRSIASSEASFPYNAI
jgi:hypothetical protein